MPPRRHSRPWRPRRFAHRGRAQREPSVPPHARAPPRQRRARRATYPCGRPAGSKESHRWKRSHPVAVRQRSFCACAEPDLFTDERHMPGSMVCSGDEGERIHRSARLCGSFSPWPASAAAPPRRRRPDARPADRRGSGPTARARRGRGHRRHEPRVCSLRISGRSKRKDHMAPDDGWRAQSARDRSGQSSAARRANAVRAGAGPVRVKRSLRFRPRSW